MGILDDGGENPCYLLEDVPYGHRRHSVRSMKGKGSKWATLPFYIGTLIMFYLTSLSPRWGAVGFMLLIGVCVPICGLIYEYDLKKKRSSHGVMA